MRRDQWAKELLLGSRLESKLLVPPSEFEAGDAPRFERPEHPGRPAALPITDTRGRFDFPKASVLVQSERRGEALHYFANHELLAIEIMALALLAFPDTESAFMDGLVQTIVEEQRHLRMYQEQMNRLGVELGDVPVNGFFWRVLRGMKSPREFVVTMSLTLEQANLDYMKHYASIFREVGDDRSAAILDKVYEDEIGHVAHGLHWFRAFDQGKEGSDWQRYVAALEPPMSPSRAKGPVFDREGRKRAGLDDLFIRELSVYRSSKGRTPRHYCFNPDVEVQLRNGPGYQENDAVARVRTDLDFVMSFLAARDDCVHVDQRPSLELLERLESAGFEVPQLISDDSEPPPPSEVIRWGQADEALRPLFEKRFGAAQLRQYLPGLAAGAPVCSTDSVGVVRSDRTQILEAADTFFARGYEKVVIKPNLSSSARGRIFLSPDRPLHRQEEGALDKPGEFVIEPWFDRVLDLSLVLDARRGVRKPLLGRYATINDPRGAYLGHRLTRPLASLGADGIRQLRVGSSELPKALEDIAVFVVTALNESGYAGPAGVDAFVYRTTEGLRLRPIVEVNPRFTMGHVAHRISRRVSPGRAAFWFQTRKRESDRLALGTLELAGDGRLARGVLFTTDPTFAKQHVTFVVVGEDDADCRAQLEDSGLGWPMT